ncbi:phage distal tail protein [Anaerorhabdus furcosa]|uniref:Phage tail protein n=1 Tax=Anaerorhabdus furcosa TaxID=118967 RepID=A0A1T4LR12_9FIRM|nr:phage tail domain-containing protein [Anaerorhabdus furcosa]SJZ57170.1 Phage tail protein [Anaerorhabdus furcosa]
MDKKYLLLTFDNGISTLKMGVGETIKVVRVEGFEAPDYILHTTSIATADGVRITGKKVDERSLNITFGIDDINNTEVYRKQIQKFFNPNKTIKLKMNWCYSQAQIECELEEFSWSSIESMWSYLEGSVALKCPFPFWSDLDNFGKNIAAITPMFTFPLGMINFNESGSKNLGYQVMGYNTLSKEVLLNNKGDVPTGVEIHFIAKRGVVKNPKITLLSSGEFIEVVQDMAKNDVIVVNTNVGKKGITKNGVNIFKEKNKLSTFFQLELGDNKIAYDALENYTNLDVRVYYTPKYLGV